MALRLTTSLREQISLAVLRHRFSPEVGAAMRQRAALADDIYTDFYRKPDREKMEALPAGWLPQTVCASAKFGEYGSGYAQINFSGSFTGMLHRLRPSPEKPGEETSRRVLTKHQHACWKVYAADHKLAVRYEEHRNLVSDLEARIRVSEKQIETALNAVSSAAALVKAWPEIEPFVTPLVPVVRALPALPVSALNETFKLPVKKAA
jgi:hypothetical protein